MRAQTLTKNEVQELFSTLGTCDADVRDKAVFSVLYKGGGRISATLRIMPGDVDWDRNLVIIHRDKGNKGRSIVLTDSAMTLLREWANRRRALGLNGDRPFFCAVQVDALGNPLAASHFRRKIARMRERAGIEKRCHLHGLRHTAASEWFEEGIPIGTISRQLGHSHVSTTSIYLHELRPDIGDARLRERD